jgi:hypothetical protein
MCVAGFPEAEGLRNARRPAAAGPVGDFDVVHDNQVLATGMLAIEGLGLPLVTTIHHPISVDRRLDLAAATTWRKRLTLRRWYGFLRMQTKVARKGRRVLTPRRRPSATSSADFGVDPSRVRVIRWASTTASARRPAPRVARPDRGDGQRRRADEGHRHPARGVRQAAHRAGPPRAAARRQDPAGRAGPTRSSTGLAIRDHVRFVHGISDPSWSR